MLLEVSSQDPLVSFTLIYERDLESEDQEKLWCAALCCIGDGEGVYGKPLPSSDLHSWSELRLGSEWSSHRGQTLFSGVNAGGYLLIINFKTSSLAEIHVLRGGCTPYSRDVRPRFGSVDQSGGKKQRLGMWDVE